MRNDEIYRPKPQSMQMELPGLGSEGERLMNEAREWCEQYPGAWDAMLEKAIWLADHRGYVSANYLVNYVRNELGVGIKNGYAPALARIIGEKVPRIAGKFHKHSSMTDGFAS